MNKQFKFNYNVKEQKKCMRLDALLRPFSFVCLLLPVFTFHALQKIYLHCQCWSITIIDLFPHSHLYIHPQSLGTPSLSHLHTTWSSSPRLVYYCSFVSWNVFLYVFFFIYFRWGVFVCLHPYPIILASALLTALTGIGLIRFRYSQQRQN